MMGLRMSRDLPHDVFANVAGLSKTGSSVQYRILNKYDAIIALFI